MALTGSTIASTYLKLLRANSDTMGADATASYIQDSADTDSVLSISTTRVGIGNAAPASVLHLTGTMQVGVDGAGHDVIFYGNSASSNMTWDTSADDLILNDARLVVQQDDAEEAVFIDQNGNDKALHINTITTTSYGLVVQGDALTTGKLGYFYSDAPDNTSSRNLVEIVNTNAAADNAVGLYIHQDGDDAHIEFAGAGGGGIKFTADIASSDSSTLDDYEEGTWTIAATMADSGTVSMASGIDLASYTKIGNLVHVQGYVSIASVSSPVGALQFSLPIATASLSESSDEGATGIFTYSVDYTAGHAPAAKWGGGASLFQIIVSVDDSSGGYPVPTAGDYYAFSFSYHAAT